MAEIMHVRAKDTLLIHYTTIGQVYRVIEMDDECYRIEDDRGRTNWVPFRYFEVVADDEDESQA